jgi:hypothetical protein
MHFDIPTMSHVNEPTLVETPVRVAKVKRGVDERTNEGVGYESEHRDQVPTPRYEVLVQQMQTIIASRFISIYPALVGLTGSINAAVLLSSCLYWTRTTRINELERERAAASAKAAMNAKRGAAASPSPSVSSSSSSSSSSSPFGIPDRDPARTGWFWKTRENWRIETGLGRHEQEAARRQLVEAGFLREQLRGSPARLYYWADEKRIYSIIRDRAKGTPGAEIPPAIPDDVIPSKPVMHRALGLVVPLSQAFLQFTGDLNACLVLARLFTHVRFHKMAYARDGWVNINIDALARDLGMGRSQLERGRAVLIDSHLIAQSLGNTVEGRTVQVRLDLAQMIALHAGRVLSVAPHQVNLNLDDPGEDETETETILGQDIDLFSLGLQQDQTDGLLGLASSGSETPLLTSDSRQNPLESPVNTPTLEISQLQRVKPANCNADNPPSSWQVSSVVYNKGNTSEQQQPIPSLFETPDFEPTTPSHDQPEKRGGSSFSDLNSESNSTSASSQNSMRSATANATNAGNLPTGKGNLIIPPVFDNIEAQHVKTMLRPAESGVHQQILDEIGGQAAAGRSIRDPMLLLAALVQRSNQGLFVPTAAITHAAKRQRRQAEDAVQVAAASAPKPEPAAKTVEQKRQLLMSRAAGWRAVGQSKKAEALEQKANEMVEL